MPIFVAVDAGNFTKDVPDIITAAAKSQLGILALMIVVLSLLAWAFFRNAITISAADLGSGSVIVEVKHSVTFIQADPVQKTFDLPGAAKYLGMSNRKLRDLCLAQKITHSKIDYRNYRFNRADLDEYQNSFKVWRKPILP